EITRNEIGALNRQRELPQRGQRANRSRRVAAPTAKPRLDRNLLVDRHTHARRLAATAGRAPQLVCRAPDEILIIGRATWIVARDRERPVIGRKRQRVVERHRLKHRPQLVIAVRPRAQYTQRQIDFRWRANLNSTWSSAGAALAAA